MIKSAQSLTRPRFATTLLTISMFSTGACGLVSEYALSTVSTYILGNSIEQFSVTIALMMFMMGFAGWAQKFVSDEHLFEKFVVLETMLMLAGGFAPIAIYAAFGFLHSHFLIVLYFFVVTIGFLIGFEIPLILRVNEKYSDGLPVNLSRIFSADYIGSFAGAIVWTFYLLKRFPLTEIGFLMAWFNFIIVSGTLFYFLQYGHGLVRLRKTMIILFIITAAALLYGYKKNTEWNIILEQRLYEDKVIFAQTTKYQRLVMTHNSKLDEYRFYINGNLQFSSLDEFIYHEQLVHPAMSIADSRKSVLILGGGDGMALREVLKYKDVSEITLVDIDPEMTKFCSGNEVMKKLNNNAFKDSRVTASVPAGITEKGVETIYQQNENRERRTDRSIMPVAQVKVMNIDADLFLNTAGKKFDAVIIDFPDPSSIELAKLFSKEFYLKLREVVSDKGIVVIQATSPYHAKETYLCAIRSIEAAGYKTIPYHDNVPSFGDWGWILAWKDTGREEVMAARISALSQFKVATKYLTPEVFRKAMVFGKGMLETEQVEINTLMNPVLLRYYLDESWLVE